MSPCCRLRACWDSCFVSLIESSWLPLCSVLGHVLGAFSVWPCPAGSVSPLRSHPSLACLGVCIVDSRVSGLPQAFSSHSISFGVSCEVDKRSWSQILESERTASAQLDQHHWRSVPRHWAAHRAGLQPRREAAQVFWARFCRRCVCSPAIPAAASLSFLSSFSVLSTFLTVNHPPSRARGRPSSVWRRRGLHFLPGLPCWACGSWGRAVTHESGLLLALLSRRYRQGCL